MFFLEEGKLYNEVRLDVDDHTTTSVARDPFLIES